MGTLMLPDRNNVYGTLRAPAGLDQVRDAAEKMGCWESARVYTSGYDGAQTMRLSAAGAEFETTPAGGIEHLISGAVGGTLGDVPSGMLAAASVSWERERPCQTIPESS